jgi:hypothetical protein
LAQIKCHIWRTCRSLSLHPLLLIIGSLGALCVLFRGFLLYLLDLLPPSTLPPGPIAGGAFARSKMKLFDQLVKQVLCSDSAPSPPGSSSASTKRSAISDVDQAMITAVIQIYLGNKRPGDYRDVVRKQLATVLQVNALSVSLSRSRFAYYSLFVTFILRPPLCSPLFTVHCLGFRVERRCSPVTTVTNST